jgi:hypothetical protein
MTAIEPIELEPGAPYQELLEVVFMPMLVSANWWGSAFLPWCPPGVADAPHHGRHQLTVPDPVEREGEHALFA